MPMLLDLRIQSPLSSRANRDAHQRDRGADPPSTLRGGGDVRGATTSLPKATPERMGPGSRPARWRWLSMELRLGRQALVR